MDDLRDPVARDDPRAEDAADPDLRRRDLEPSRETTRIRTAKAVAPAIAMAKETATDAERRKGSASPASAK